MVSVNTETSSQDYSYVCLIRLVYFCPLGDEGFAVVTCDRGTNLECIVDLVASSEGLLLCKIEAEEREVCRWCKYSPNAALE